MSSKKLFSCRGCYYKVSYGGDSGPFWRLNPPISSSCPILIQNAYISEKDLVPKTVCFNDVRVATTFSRDFGQINVSGVALLGEANKTGSFGADLKAWFDQNRIYKKGRPITVSSKLTGAHSFLLEQYELNNANVDLNIQGFTLGGAQVI